MIHHTRSDDVKYLVLRLLADCKAPQVLKQGILRIWYILHPSDGILSEEVELNPVIEDSYVLDPESCGADGVSLVFVFLVPHPHAEFVDEVGDRGGLASLGVIRRHILLNLLAEKLQFCPNLLSLVVLFLVPGLLDGRALVRPDVLLLAGQLIDPFRNPNRLPVVDDLARPTFRFWC